MIRSCYFCFVLHSCTHHTYPGKYIHRWRGRFKSRIYCLSIRLDLSSPFHLLHSDKRHQQYPDDVADDLLTSSLFRRKKRNGERWASEEIRRYEWEKYVEDTCEWYLQLQKIHSKATPQVLFTCIVELRWSTFRAIYRFLLLGRCVAVSKK